VKNVSRKLAEDRRTNPEKCNSKNSPQQT